MPRGQFATVFTLGFATAIALLGVVAAAIVFWSGEAWAWAYVILEAHQLPNSWLEPTYLALFVAGAGLLAAYWLVRIQQSIVAWAAGRTIARLGREYNEVAQRHGRDQADQFIKQRARALFERERFDLFGRDELARAIAAASVHASREV
ncbi:hypothetical protein FDV58_24825 [Bradyrhizobium elkanii]|uniref:Uncharacterized protein n=1 Tax=Bradyrhizobium elkanii TaxID=29448 RepID=A0A4U6RX15_BRAEL|nr:hypothetical protein [Bradyrhizobium elkanii]TKV78928.1 hypothetical protein FDV58_24825 [Bradyrhizobium elkanii]